MKDRPIGALAVRRAGEPPHSQQSTLSELFHENTKRGPVTGRAQSEAIQTFLGSSKTQDLLTRSFKTYSLQDRLQFPEVQPRAGLEAGIVARRSVRSYGDEPIVLESLARLLYLTCGLTGPQRFFRPVGSGGALYPLELYLVPRRVVGLDDGIYHYDPETHGLDTVARDDRWARVVDEMALGGIDVEHLAALFVITATFRRTTCKYGDRGYRLVLMEAGAVAHNLTLLATSEQIGSCQIGEFNDARLSALLEIDGIEEAPLLAVALGSLPDDPPAEDSAATDSSTDAAKKETKE